MMNLEYSQGILQYIPFFYVIWSDDLLSASEISVVRDAIAGDTSLDGDEKARLVRWLDPLDPPGDLELKRWGQLLAKAGAKVVEADNYPLAAFSGRLLDPPLGKPNPQLQHIEITLGIQPNHYNHLFQVEVVPEKTSVRYSAEALDAILMGPHAELVAGFRQALKDPLFSWEVVRDKELHRGKTLAQTKLLAQKGYGT